jgi:hypothetical protein
MKKGVRAMPKSNSFLLAFQGKDNRKIVLEFESEHYLSGKLNAANELGMWVRRLTLEELRPEDFRDVQVYDMRHDATSKIFHLEQWRNYLLTEDKVLSHSA